MCIQERVIFEKVLSQENGLTQVYSTFFLLKELGIKTNRSRYIHPTAHRQVYWIQHTLIQRIENKLRAPSLHPASLRGGQNCILSAWKDWKNIITLDIESLHRGAPGSLAPRVLEKSPNYLKIKQILPFTLLRWQELQSRGLPAQKGNSTCYDPDSVTSSAYV